MEKEQFSLLGQNVLGGKEAQMREELLKRKEEAKKKREAQGLSLISMREGNLSNRSQIGAYSNPPEEGRSFYPDNSLRKLDTSRVSQMPTMMSADRLGLGVEKKGKKFNEKDHKARNIIDKLDETRREIDLLKDRERSRALEARKVNLERAIQQPVESMTPVAKKKPQMQMEHLYS